MDQYTIIYATLTLFLLGILFTYILTLAHKKLAVPVDETTLSIQSILPGANCGACGYPGCAAYASAIVKGKASVNLCTVADEDSVKNIANIIGVEVENLTKKVAFLKCQGSSLKANLKFEYHGILECWQADTMFGGHKVCEHGCLGLGSCYRACPFDAISMTAEMLIKIDPTKCKGCGLCTQVCPRGLIVLLPHTQDKNIYQVACSSPEKALDVRNACQVGCIACGLCVKNCPVNAIKIENNLAEINNEICISCGKCEEVCPTKAITHIKKHTFEKV